MFVNCLVEGKIPVKALINTSSKFNTISKKLFDSLGEEYGIGFVSVGAEKIYKDAIGEIKCLDLQFQYNGKWQSLDGTEVIDFQIRKNPSFDLVLGQDWLWVREAKISFEFSSKTCEHRAKIVIDGMSIPLTDEDFNKANSTKNNSPESDITLDELVDMFKKLSLRSKDNKQRKRYHSNISPVSPTPGRLNDDVSKNSGASKIKKYPKVDLGDGCGNLSIKTHLNNIWKSIHSIEDDIYYGIFKRLSNIENELRARKIRSTVAS
ncbi:3420_t:CDS:2 [Entrophospora sp. SA101]|nr:3415_t:CDS:2 [Entrophospora sp. SA101]CAJ0924815.1 3420_t:CDS:2 [Entrophospora sp. SA101]